MSAAVAARARSDGAESEYANDASSVHQSGYRRVTWGIAIVPSLKDVDVKVLRWPSQARERDHYRRMGVPLLLVLEDSVPPPNLDVLEDCIRQPITPDDLDSRVTALRTLALAGVPVVDSADVLRFGGNWLSLSATDARLMRLLVDSFQSVVPRAKLVDCGWPGSRPRRNAVDLRILRLRRRLSPMNLMICTVWSKGYLLDRRSGVRDSASE
jgi:hypothetical protein